MHDPKNFENPGEFRPGRFLDENGHFSYNDKVCSFSVGRRSCIGPSLIRFDSILSNILYETYYVLNILKYFFNIETLERQGTCET